MEGREVMGRCITCYEWVPVQWGWCDDCFDWACAGILREFREVLDRLAQ